MLRCLASAEPPSPEAVAAFEDHMVVNGLALVAPLTYGQASHTTGDAAGAAAQVTRLINRRGLEPNAPEPAAVLVWLGIRTQARIKEPGRSRPLQRFFEWWRRQS